MRQISNHSSDSTTGCKKNFWHMALDSLQKWRVTVSIATLQWVCQLKRKRR